MKNAALYLVLAGVVAVSGCGNPPETAAFQAKLAEAAPAIQSAVSRCVRVHQGFHASWRDVRDHEFRNSCGAAASEFSKARAEVEESIVAFHIGEEVAAPVKAALEACRAAFENITDEAYEYDTSGAEHLEISRALGTYGEDKETLDKAEAFHRAGSGPLTKCPNSFRAALATLGVDEPLRASAEAVPAPANQEPSPVPEVVEQPATVTLTGDTNFGYTAASAVDVLISEIIRQLNAISAASPPAPSEPPWKYRMLKASGLNPYVNSDDYPDLVELVSFCEEGSCNTSTHQTFLAAFNSQPDGRYVLSAFREVMGTSAQMAKDGAEIVVTSKTYGPDDPTCCPSAAVPPLTLRLARAD